MLNIYGCQSYEEYDAAQAEFLRKCPTCDRCGEKIQDEFGYEIEPGELWCWDCTEEWIKDQRVDIDEMVKEEKEGW